MKWFKIHITSILSSENPLNIINYLQPKNKTTNKYKFLKLMNFKQNPKSLRPKSILLTLSNPQILNPQTISSIYIINNVRRFPQLCSMPRILQRPQTRTTPPSLRAYLLFRLHQINAFKQIQDPVSKLQQGRLSKSKRPAKEPHGDRPGPQTLIFSSYN